MNRQEFILTLREELAKLPPEEIVEATEYFEECFADATEGLSEEAALAEEERLIKEFGSPKRIAAQIRADYAARLLDGDETVRDRNPGAKKKLSAIWWILIGLCSAPVAIPVAICVFIALFCLLLGVVCGLFGGIVGLGLGISTLTSSVAAGVMTIGIALMILAVSAASMMAVIIAAKAIVKAVSKKIKESRAAKKNGGTVEAEPVNKDDGAVEIEIVNDDPAPAAPADDEERGE